MSHLNHGFQHGELNAVAAHNANVVAAGLCSLNPLGYGTNPLIENWDPTLPGLMYTKLIPVVSSFGGVPTDGVLNGTSSDGSGFWAVGYIATTSPSRSGAISLINRTLVYHREKAGPFYLVPSPNIDGLEYLDNRLSAVCSISLNHAWAVGQYWPNIGGIARSLIIGWDGKVWSQYPAMTISASDSLAGIVSISPTDAWAVGSSWDTIYNFTLIEHWDGNSWRVTPSPNSNLVNNQLQAICAVSANDLWAVGYSYDGPIMETLIIRNRGGGWELAETFRGCLYGVSASAADDVWAVGSYLKPGSALLPLILHYNGKKWREIPSPLIPSTCVQLNGVFAVSSTEAWAVGKKYIGSTFQTLALRWDGKKWKIFPSQ